MKTHLTPLRSALSWLAALCLAGCAGLAGPPTIRLSGDEVQTLVSKAFPQEKRLLEVLDVTIAAPRTQLLPERNRLSAALDMQARDRVFGAQWKGRLEFDAALRWNPADQTVRLDQVRVQDLVVDKVDKPDAITNTALNRSHTERLSAAVAERLLENLSLYQLSGERAAQMQRLGVAPSAVTVTSRGVEITFEAIKR